VTNGTIKGAFETQNFATQENKKQNHKMALVSKDETAPEFVVSLHFVTIHRRRLGSLTAAILGLNLEILISRSRTWDSVAKNLVLFNHFATDALYRLI